jgi:hypothetical protein
MTRRPWAGKMTALIGQAGRKGQPVAERCPAPQISPSPDDQGRDPCWAHAATVCEGPQQTRRAAPLEHEPTRRKTRVGELTREWNKSAALLG